MRYRAVKGEIFMMPCKSWSRVEAPKKENVTEISFAHFKTEATHSGNYTCHTRAGLQLLHLQVVNNTVGCSSVEESRVTLWVGQGGQITCPGHNCSNSTTSVWHKGNRRVSELILRGKEVFENGSLFLHEVSKHDNNVFFCDRVVSERGVNWTIRRSVTVKALEPEKYPPRILSPENNTVQKVELGSSNTLRCEVFFPEADPGVVQWFMNDDGALVNMTMATYREEKLDWGLCIIGKVIIEQTTAHDLDKTYICFTQNKSGNNSSTVYLKKIQWPSLIEYSLAPLLFVTCLGLVVRVKWMEIQLFVKSRWTFHKPELGHKDYDVFLSYVWTRSSTELASSHRRHNNHDGAFPFSLDPLEVNVPSERLELLLPHVLEDQWGYRLCLMDRDFLPGRAYTTAVANAIQRSQLLICLLSADYLSDNNAVFVLESGVQTLLQNAGVKLQLIWINRGPVSLPQLDPPLPVVIEKALKVLPALKWTSGTNTNFWKCLRKAMPHQKLSSLQK
ncbi:interleukin-18 receptor accessory protein-like isoform X2 [Eucyclogobius newberryi]